MKILSYFKTGPKKLTAYYDEGNPRVIDINAVDVVLQKRIDYNQWIIDHNLENDPDYVLKEVKSLQTDLDYFELQLIESIPTPIYKDHKKIGIYCEIASLG